MEIRNIQTDTDNFIKPIVAVDNRPPAHPTHGNNVTCGECGMHFATSIQTNRTSGGGEQWHFLCPHCGHRYDVCHITRQGIELRRQIESVKAQLRLAPHDEELTQKKERLQAAYAAEVTPLSSVP